jgi:hypothetical protein
LQYHGKAVRCAISTSCVKVFLSLLEFTDMLVFVVLLGLL